MPDESTRTVLVALGAGLAVTLAKVGAAVLTGSAAMAAEAAHSLADNANDLSLFAAQRRSGRPPDDQHPLGYGREAYFWALIAALGVLVVGVAFSLRDGIDELIHPAATQSFAVAYVVLAVSAVFDLVSLRRSAGQMIRRARRYHREFLEESRVTSESSLRAVFLEDAVSIAGDVIAFAALALNQVTGSSVPQGVAAPAGPTGSRRCAAGCSSGTRRCGSTSCLRIWLPSVRRRIWSPASTRPGGISTCWSTTPGWGTTGPSPTSLRTRSRPRSASIAGLWSI